MYGPIQLGNVCFILSYVYKLMQSSKCLCYCEIAERGKHPGHCRKDI
jgi:hypothetical protein